MSLPPNYSDNIGITAPASNILSVPRNLERMKKEKIGSGMLDRERSLESHGSRVPRSSPDGLSFRPANAHTREEEKKSLFSVCATLELLSLLLLLRCGND